MNKSTLSVVLSAVVLILVNGLPSGLAVLPSPYGKLVADLFAVLIPFLHINGVNTAVASAKNPSLSD